MVKVSLHTEIFLGEWHANPLGPVEAKQLWQSVQDERRHGYLHGMYSGHDSDNQYREIREMIARFWMGMSIDSDYVNLCKTSRGPQQQAYVELVYGQLLMSVRKSPAMQHLQNGFMLATPYFEPHEYFEVMKRHECLQWLPLQEQPIPALPLYDLLREAAVVRELQAHVPHQHIKFNQCDTLG